MVKLTFGESADTETLPPPEGKDIEVTPKPEGKRRGRPPGSTSRAKLEDLEVQLKDKLLEDFIIPGAIASPLLAANIEKRADRTAKAIVRIASRNPAVRKGLEKALQGSDVVTVAAFFLTSAVCVMVDMSMMDPTALPARAAGVPDLWETVYEEPIGVSPNGHRRSFRRGIYAEVEDE